MTLSRFGIGTQLAGDSPAGAGDTTSDAIERATFIWGGATFPLDPASSNSVLRDADPAVWYALDFWAAVLQSYLGERWSVACAAAGLSSLASTVVAQRVPYDPIPWLTQDQFAFPLLAVCRTTGTVSDFTVAWEQSTTQWRVSWSLPPLTAAQAEILIPFLHAAMATIANRTTESIDPAYGNVNTWREAGVRLIAVKSFRYGNIEGINGLFFPTVQLTVQVDERNDIPADAYDPLEGADVAIDNANNIEAVLPDVAGVKTSA